MEDLTTQQKQRIIEDAPKSIINTLKNLDSTKNYIEQINTWELMFSELKKVSESKSVHIKNNLYSLKVLLNLNMIISIINYDLKCTYTTALEKDGKPETLFYARQLLQVVRESYRAIFGLNKDSEYLRTTESVIKNYFPERLNEYTGLIVQVRKFDSQISKIKEIRNISIHYDQDPLKVYKMLNDIDINDTFIKFNPYIKSLHQVNDFINRLIFLQIQNISRFFGK